MKLIEFSSASTTDNTILLDHQTNAQNNGASPCPDLSRYDIIMLNADAGAVDVEGSFDGGATYKTGVLNLENQNSTTPATRVLVTAPNNIYRVAPGIKLSRIRIRLNGATAVTKGQLLLARSAGD